LARVRIRFLACWLSLTELGLCAVRARVLTLAATLLKLSIATNPATSNRRVAQPDDFTGIFPEDDCLQALKLRCTHRAKSTGSLVGRCNCPIIGKLWTKSNLKMRLCSRRLSMDIFLGLSWLEGFHTGTSTLVMVASVTLRGTPGERNLLHSLFREKTDSTENPATTDCHLEVKKWLNTWARNGARKDTTPHPMAERN